MSQANRARTKIIAEACANHLGDRQIQEEMIWAAAEAGADYIKFQSWQAGTNTRGQSDTMQAYELSDEDHFRLIEVAEKAGIRFATTVFDVQRVPFVAGLNCDFVKVASPDCSSRRLLEELAHAQVPQVIVSTGMSDTTEVEQTVSWLTDWRMSAAFLHCIYPLVDGGFHLRRLEMLRQFASQVGLSDHSAGDDLRASQLAIALGADWIERHFILDHSLTEAKDAKVSIDPQGLRSLVEAAQNPTEYLTLADEHPELMGELEPTLSDKVQELREFYVGRWGDNR